MFLFFLFSPTVHLVVVLVNDVEGHSDNTHCACIRNVLALLALVWHPAGFYCPFRL